jgi:nucleotide-binding universal stress UspA family protein
MTNASPDVLPSTPLADLSVNAQPLSRSDDPAIRGPVLLASEGRGKTDAPFRIAAAIAAHLGTDVEVAGVLEPYPVLLLGQEPVIYPPDFESIREDALKTAIARRLSAVGRSAERWPVSVFYGEPGSTIARVAHDKDATMIVVGLGQHGLVDRLSVGERALRVLRAADRPVLAVAPGAVALPQRVIVGMDFSPASVRAARAALLMLGHSGVLTLVHVRPAIDMQLLRATTEFTSRSYERLLELWHAKMDMQAATLFTRLRDELRPYARPGVTIQTQTKTGRVFEQLLAAADETTAHLIAVGTHGPGLVERFFVGSVATDVLRHAGRSVLVAPAPNAAECARIELRLQGTAEFSRADDWGLVLERFSVRNDGRRVRLEVEDPAIGAQVQQEGLALLGVVYDQHDKRIDIMMGDPRNRVRHLTHSISAVEDVGILAAADGPERALRILSGRSQTLITFLD